MGLLDIPRGLISRLPLVGGSNDANDDPDDDAPDTDEVPDEPDVDQTDDEVDEPDQVDDPDEDPDDDGAEDEPDDSTPEASSDADDSADNDTSDDDTSDDGESDADKSDNGDSSSDGTEDISDTTAPSIGPNTVIEKDSPEERLAKHDQSDTDAMGLDKRREVIGGNYGASFGKQLLSWIAVVIVVAAAAFGLKLLVDDLDKAPAHAADEAPWSGSDQKPAPLE